MKLLSVEGLRVANGKEEPVRASSFSIDYNEMKALIGESGSGKSLTAKAVMGLLPKSFRAEGNVFYEGRDILGEDRIAPLRGHEISMIVQNAAAALNPLYRIADGIRMIARQNRSGIDAGSLLKATGLESEGRKYPHELSGGMQQRALIAAALAASPSLLIADEITSSLDRETETSIMELLLRMKREHSLSILFISHSISLASSYADSIAVMHGGETIEEGPADEVTGHPAHPYTEALIRASRLERQADGRLFTIRGRMPSAAERIAGCTFADRCPLRSGRCQEKPAWTGSGSHRWRCFNG